MKILAFITVILIIGVNCESLIENNEDYSDPVLSYLLYGTNTELLEEDDDEYKDLDAELDPVFSEGAWLCGICDNMAESKLIYSENNEVDTNIDEDDFLEVQVGLSFTNMRCVAVLSDEECIVKRISGSCSGLTVTLSVAESRQFVVKVFGD
ncbi:uncharacterized protein [Battus philenor]|uniref:uncharacterized protein n=1 Tax=Battus philenor TaxID=42288 RepID=UPI0035CF80DA